MGILSVTDDNKGLTVLLVNNYAGQPAGEVQQAEGQLSLHLQDQQAAVQELVPICQQLARISAKSQQLLGADQAQQAQIFEWLTWAAADLALVTDEKLQYINTHLASRTFLAGNSTSLADLVVFSLVHPAVANMPSAQFDGFCNLLRWYDLMQHTADSCKLFTPVAIPLPAFVPPPPPAASTRPAKSTAATSAAPASEGKKDKAAAAAGSSAGDVSSKSSSTTAAAAPAAAGGKAKGDGAKEGKQKEAKEGGKGKKEAAAAGGGGGKAKEPEEARIDMLDIRVGKIMSVQQHPNADALYLEEIDVGEDKPRQVISGLVKFVPKEKMENRRVVVCCNLKPAKMRDIMSYGMVLCASNETHDQVDPITPPEGVPVGERITFEGYTSAPMEEINPKKKVLERLFPDLKTGPDGTPNYKGVPFMTSKGPVTSTLPNASVA